MKRKYLYYSLLGIFFCGILPLVVQANNDWRKKLIRTGQTQLQSIIAQNQWNDKHNLSHQNQYIVSLMVDYPHSEYIRQERGTRKGKPVDGYMLVPSHLQQHNQTLKALNQSAAFSSYLILINGIPLDFSPGVPDYGSIKEVFAGREGVDQPSIEVTQKAAQEAQDLILAMTSHLIQEIKEPVAMYCGLVKFEIFEGGKRITQNLVYYPNPQGFADGERYQGLLDAYMTKASWDLDKPSENVGSLIEQIRKANASYNSVEDVLAGADQVTDPKKMLELLQKVSKNAFQLIDKDLRIHILKVLSKEKMGNEAERMAARVIRTSPGLEADALLHGLQAPNDLMDSQPVLLNRLLSQTEDGQILLWGENNYQALIEAFVYLFAHSQTYRDTYDRINNDLFYLAERLMVWDKDYTFLFFQKPPVGTGYYQSTLQADGNLQVSRMYVDRMELELQHDLQSDEPNIYLDLVPKWEETEGKQLHPFEPVVLYNQSGIGMLTGAGVAQGQPTIVPAIVLLYARDKLHSEQFWKGLSIVVDAASLATGPGAWIKAGKVSSRMLRYAQRAWVLFEVGNAVGNLTLNTGLIEDENFKQLVEYHNLLMAAIGIGHLGKFTLQQTVRSVRSLNAVNWTHAQTYIHLWKKVQNNAAVFQKLSKEQKDKIHKLAEVLKREHKNVTGRALEAISSSDKYLTQLKPLSFAFENADLNKLLTGINWKNNDGILELFIHAEGNRYVAYIENASGRLMKLEMNEAGVAEVLKKIPTGKNTVIRLLSCSDLASARKFSGLLDKHVVYATEDLVKVYEDGGITTIARSGNSTQKWRKLKNGEDIGEAPVPARPKGEGLEFVVMGKASSSDITSQVKSIVTDIKSNYPAFFYGADGCYHRANLVAEQLLKQNISCKKIFAFGNLKTTSNYIHPSSGLKEAKWKYHVAISIEINNNGNIGTYVVDPLMSDIPITTQDWLKNMNQNPWTNIGSVQTLREDLNLFKSTRKAKYWKTPYQIKVDMNTYIETDIKYNSVADIAYPNVTFEDNLSRSYNSILDFDRDSKIARLATDICDGKTYSLDKYDLNERVICMAEYKDAFFKTNVDLSNLYKTMFEPDDMHLAAMLFYSEGTLSGNHFDKYYIGYISKFRKKMDEIGGDYKKFQEKYHKLIEIVYKKMRLFQPTFLDDAFKE